MSQRPNPEMLILARELLGLSQTDLAEITGIHHASISRYEGGLVPVPENELAILAEALDLPVEFFFRPGQRRGAESGDVFHRKRSKSSAKQLKVIYALLDLIRLNMEIFLRQVDVNTPYSIPDYNLRDFKGSIEDVAQSVRSLWNMPLGHVRNLTETLEKAFCMIHVFDFGTDDIDEITQWVEPLPPIILVNRRVPGDRLRFSLAHALGHLVMHHGLPPYPLMEKEANQFAGAFLMPERDIRHDLKPVTIERMLGLKPLWKVSIGAMIMRARELNLITDKREKSLHQTYNHKGYSKNEPYPIPVERPTLSTKLLSLYLDERQYSHAEIAQLLHTKEHRFREWYMPDDPQIRLVPKKESSRSIG